MICNLKPVITSWYTVARRRIYIWCDNSGEPGLVDRVLALHAGSRGFDSHRGHMSERFFRSNRPGYPHPVSPELEKWWYQSGGRWLQSHWTSAVASALSNRQNCACARKTLQTQRGRTHGAGSGCGNGSVPLSHSGNVVTRIGIHTHTHTWCDNSEPDWTDAPVPRLWMRYAEVRGSVFGRMGIQQK